MRKTLWSRAALIVVAVGLLSACQVTDGTSAPQPAAAPKQLRVGDVAPDFSLQDQNRQNISLSDYRGKTVQLAFYVWAFSGG